MGKIKDIAGQVFGRLTAVSLGECLPGRQYVWNCVCACGAHLAVEGRHLRSGQATSCGCGKAKAPSNGVDLTGKTFGLLTVKSFRREGGKRWWTCQCECGTTREFVTGHLTDSRQTKAARHCGASVHKTHPLSLEKLVMGYYKNNAKARGLEFSLTAEQFSDLIHADCHYCGAKPTGERRFISSRRPTRTFRCNGVDRVRNEVGYTASNSVPCCSLCNHMKGVLTPEAFLSHVASIAEHNSRPHLRRVA